MPLNLKQISKIKQKIFLDEERTLVRINVSEEKALPAEESNFNIYCVDRAYNIIWQVTETKTKPLNDADMFVYLGKSKDAQDNIIADRFSGFVYKSNPYGFS
jgi:hypothetical protein